MADAVFLVTRTVQGVNQDINGVRAVIVHEDDAQTDAVIIASLLINMNLTEKAGDPAGNASQYPDGYFDTVSKIGLTPSGEMDTGGNFLAFAPQVSSLNA